MKKAIIFDFFGVISSPYYYPWLERNVDNFESQKEYFQQLSKNFDTGKFNFGDIVQNISEKTNIPREKVDLEMNEIISINQEIVKLIGFLKSNYKIGILSDANSEFVQSVLIKHNIQNYFDSVVVSSDLGITKPNPKIFKAALNSLNVIESEAVFIDDHTNNVSAAQNIGIDSILYEDIDGLKKELEEYGIVTSNL